MGDKYIGFCFILDSKFMINFPSFVSSILEISIVFYIGWVYVLEPFCFLFDLKLLFLAAFCFV